MIKIINLDNIINNLETVKTTLTNELPNYNNNLANHLHKRILPDMPKDTAGLIHSKTIFNTLVSVVLVKTFLAYNIEYAQYQERGRRADGTYRIKNRPAGGKTGFVRDNLRNFSKTFSAYNQKWLDSVFSNLKSRMR